MSRFQRDTDLDCFDSRTDVTAGMHHRLSPVQITSASKGGSNDLGAEDAALESLRKRMAGPSSAKAGLSRNVDEINRKIYEASKGSKFFENEKRQDERTTQQVNKMLAKRDEKLQITPPGSKAWNTIEKQIDERAIQLEASRDLSRIILHADMDMFYCAVEVKRDPSLKGKAFGVGSGVLTTASYEARDYGVRSGMATHIALALCPHLITVKNDMPSYVAISDVIMAVFAEYDPGYARMSLDEAYLDVTAFCEMNQVNVTQVVEQLQAQVKAASGGLTVSVGIAPNKMLAKISSDRNKPNGYFQVQSDRGFIMNLMQELPCRKIPGIGRVTERLLSSLNVETCGDIWRHRVTLSMVLNDLDFFLKAYLGIHSNVVEPSKREERKSVGREHTFQPTNDPATLKELLKESALQVGKDLERLDYQGKTVTLTFKTDTFRRFTRAKTMHTYQYKGEDIYVIACKLLDQEYLAKGGNKIKMRLIGVRLTSLKDIRLAQDGSLKEMFEKSRKSPLKQDHQMEDQDNFDYEQALLHSLLDEEDSGKRELHAPEKGNTELLAECPICQQHIKCTGTADQLNVTLNQHIDQCLSRQASPPQIQVPLKGKRKAGPMDSFVLRKVKQA